MGNGTKATGPGEGSGGVVGHEVIKLYLGHAGPSVVGEYVGDTFFKKNNTVFLLESEFCLGKVSKLRKVLS